MKTLRLFGLALLMISLGFVSCGDDEENEPQNIAELASATDNLSTLVAALDAADLVSTLEGTGPFTVFAPTNAAFDKFLSNNGFSELDDVPVEVLKNILLNHVVGGKNISTGLTTGYVESSATGAGGNTMCILSSKCTTNYHLMCTTNYHLKCTTKKSNDSRFKNSYYLDSLGIS